MVSSPSALSAMEPFRWVLSAMVPGVRVKMVVEVAGVKILISVVVISSPKILRTGPGALGFCA